jgi:hypothetical protein
MALDAALPRRAAERFAGVAGGRAELAAAALDEVGELPNVGQRHRLPWLDLTLVSVHWISFLRHPIQGDEAPVSRHGNKGLLQIETPPALI